MDEKRHPWNRIPKWISPKPKAKVIIRDFSGNGWYRAIISLLRK